MFWHTNVIKESRTSCVLQNSPRNGGESFSSHTYKNISCVHLWNKYIHSCKWSFLTVKATIWHLKPWERACFFAISQVSTGSVELLRRLKTSPGLLGWMPALYFSLTVENPRVDLGISWFWDKWLDHHHQLSSVDTSPPSIVSFTQRALGKALIT